MYIAEVLQSVDKTMGIIREVSTPMSSDAFWGIIGTIIGTVIGALLCWVLSEAYNHGRLHCYVKAWNADLDILDDRGNDIPCNMNNRPEFFNYYFTMEIYNSSRLPKIIRNGKILFCKDEKPLKAFTPKDGSTGKKVQNSTLYSDLNAVCVPATNVITLGLLGNIMGDEKGLSFLEDANEVYFQYNDEKNRTRKWKIADVSYDSYFDNDIGDEDNG